MIRKSYFFIAFIFILSGCTTNQTKLTDSTSILETNTQEKKEIIISYEEYQRLFENSQKKIKKVDEPIITPEEYKKMIAQGKKVQKNSTNSSDNEIKEALMEFYKEWKGVKYKFGGNSKRGIDCSAFTQRIFKEKFNVKIPRNTRTQVKSGQSINKSQLQLGDLVFFKTGKYDRHVGVYMGDGRFMHASIKGVKFTKLNKPFYKKAYWTSRRVLED